MLNILVFGSQYQNYVLMLALIEAMLTSNIVSYYGN